MRSSKPKKVPRSLVISNVSVNCRKLEREKVNCCQLLEKHRTAVIYLCVCMHVAGKGKTGTTVELRAVSLGSRQQRATQTRTRTTRKSGGNEVSILHSFDITFTAFNCE